MHAPSPSVTPALPLGDQSSTPYLTALKALAERDWLRLHVPAHQGRAQNAPEIASLIGERALQLDFPMSAVSMDQHTWTVAQPGAASPLQAAENLAANAWSARRAWFVTNGASGANHIATTVASALGNRVIVQRSVHSSVIDGIAHSGLHPVFLQPHVDDALAAAHGVTAQQIDAALRREPSATSVLIVSPSYFGAVADIPSIAEVTRRHDVPLIVDEAWGAHFGMHAALPQNAAAAGADLVISSTHKGAGALTQAAMIHLGDTVIGARIESLVERVVRSFQSTSTSALLLASLDAARHNLVAAGDTTIPAALASVSEIRSSLANSTRFRDATDDARRLPGVAGQDPFKVVIDVRRSGLSGNEARFRLIRDHAVNCEMATPFAVLVLVGATSPTNPDRLLGALESLPDLGMQPADAEPLPEPGRREMDVREAFFAANEVVSSEEAIGRVSADSLAAYPPGIPNVVPGEVLTQPVVEYLRAAAQAPSGFVRGAAHPHLALFRVVRRS